MGHDPTIARRRPTLSVDLSRPILIGSSRCVHVSPGESSKALLKTRFKARALMVIAWTSSPPYQCASFDARVSNAHNTASCPAKMNFHGNIVSHGRKREDWRVYNLGRNNAFALPPQYSNQGPLTRGPFTCQPSHSSYHVAPPGRPRELMWPYHASVSHSRHTGACVALPHGLACHVAFARVPHHVTSARGSCGN